MFLLGTPERKRSFHRLNPFIRFAQSSTWTLEEVRRIDSILDTSWGWKLEDYDPTYLKSLGEPNLLDKLRADIREFFRIEKEPLTLPSTRSLLRTPRKERGRRLHSKLEKKISDRREELQATLPKRKTRTAQMKVDQQLEVLLTSDQRYRRYQQQLEIVKYRTWGAV